MNPSDTSNNCDIIDTETKDNYTMRDTPLLRKSQINNGPTMLLPDDSDMKTKHFITLKIPSLLTKARIAYALPTITKSLLSTSSTWNKGGEERFMEKEVYTSHKGIIILKVKREY